AQNAGSATSKPLMTIMRLDKVTVHAMIPATAAPYVNRNTEATISIRLDETDPDRVLQLKSRVTRTTNWLNRDKGRDMRVEVDLFNPPESDVRLDPAPDAELDYRGCQRRGITSLLAAFGSTHPCNSVTLLAGARRCSWGRSGLLKDGMYGEMELVLRKFKDAY